MCYVLPRDLPPFPTRRSSDLSTRWAGPAARVELPAHKSGFQEGENIGIDHVGVRRAHAVRQAGIHLQDRKSTRLNSSHLVISYAVFCLKTKNARDKEKKYTE